MSEIGKYLEISGEIVGQIVAEQKETLLVRETIVDKELAKRENEELETIFCLPNRKIKSEETDSKTL